MYSANATRRKRVKTKTTLDQDEINTYATILTIGTLAVFFGSIVGGVYLLFDSIF